MLYIHFFIVDYSPLWIYNTYLHSKLLQSCPTLCDPMDCSLPSSSVYGILQEEYWSGLPWPLPGDLPDAGVQPASLRSPSLAGGFFITRATWQSLITHHAVLKLMLTCLSLLIHWEILKGKESYLTFLFPKYLVLCLASNSWKKYIYIYIYIYIYSVVSDSVWQHRRQPTRLPHPWDSPGKNTGVGCHFFLQCRKVKSESEFAQSCPTLCDPMDCSLPGSSVHGIVQARVLEWGAIAFSVFWCLVSLNSVLGPGEGSVLPPALLF